MSMECVDVARGRGVWVSGPAKVVIERGSFMATGFVLESGAEIIVRGERGSSLYALEDSRLCLGLGANGAYRLVERGYGLVEAWQRLVRGLEETGSKRIVVVGAPESGKSTLSTWLRNALGLCVVEADIGQNELGTPGMVSLASPGNEHVLSLQDLVPSKGFFVGHVSAEKVMDLVIAATVRAARECREYVMDTDGFVAHRGVVYKRALIEAVGPDTVIVLGQERLARELSGLGVDVVKAPSVPPELVRLRSRGDRRAYRQRLYASLFSASKPIVLRGATVAHLCPYSIGGEEVVYTCTNTVFVESRRRPDVPARWLRPGWAKGLLAGIRSDDGDTLAIVEDLDIPGEKIVLKPAGNREVGADSVRLVLLGWVRVRDDYSEEHYQPAPLPEALETRHRPLRAKRI